MQAHIFSIQCQAFSSSNLDDNGTVGAVRGTVEISETEVTDKVDCVMLSIIEALVSAGFFPLQN